MNAPVELGLGLALTAAPFFYFAFLCRRSTQSFPPAHKKGKSLSYRSQAAAYHNMTVNDFFRHTVAPIFLMTTTPLTVAFLAFTVIRKKGNCILAAETLPTLGFVAAPTFQCARLLTAFAALQLALYLVLPKKKHVAPTTPGGNIPIYWVNGLQVYAVMMVTVVYNEYARVVTIPTTSTSTSRGGEELGLLHWTFEHLDEMLSTAQIGMLFICVFFYLKGLFAPGPFKEDAGSTGNILFDFYWGTELHPRVGWFDMKHFVMCRLGMTFWPILLASCIAAQRARYGEVSHGLGVSVALQSVYLTKFFWWESGYMSTIDIAEDRAGFYLMSILTWLPALYPCQAFFLVDNARGDSDLSSVAAATTLVLGVAAIWCNYAIDAQRTHFRNCSGRCKIFGKPAEFIEAEYTTAEGTKRHSKLLCSGWWAVSRHFNYATELLSTFFWTVPAAGEGLCLFPWCYLIFLTVLLGDRFLRDEKKCSAKYGAAWAEYKRRVPWGIIPGIY